ncbi:polysaccharide export protein [Oleiphilus messinensis]|uniref:Polysaccharide export protein n=1 Tax=Oleiphilus messinensis TaxID=141451 RepID=A0A1Y0I9Q2_9GAMM|nr:SLBB domain-containing protein [Oleiphilus messinensis]ARU56899.1 polysaccharide export protein [Oleiphilus messinensis]
MFSKGVLPFAKILLLGISFLAIVFKLLVAPNIALAITPTQEQLAKFRQLPKSEKERLAKLAGIDLKTFSSTQSNFTSQPQENKIDEQRAQPEPKMLEPPVTHPLEEGNGTEALSDQDNRDAELLPFGYELFSNPISSFEALSQVPVPIEYVLGPGDTLNVQLFGQLNEYYELTVNREGQIQLPESGPVPVSGMKFEDAKELLKKQIKEKSIGVEVSISLGRLRSVQIFVIGDVEKPGAYTVSALSTMMNALLLSGGVKKIGSMRNIQLKRNSKHIATLDLYDLLLSGDASNDRRLLSGDIIFVPTVKESISIKGEVNRPAIYELKGNTTIGDALAMAGGMTPYAYPKLSSIERFNTKHRREVDTRDLSSPKSLSRSVSAGDIITIGKMSDHVTKAIHVEGSVLRPGIFEWREGIRVGDILQNITDFIDINADLNYSLIVREINPKRDIEVLNFDLGNAILHPASEKNPTLKPNDRILVFDRYEPRDVLLAPIIKQLKSQTKAGENTQLVKIEGGVNYPGAYPLPRNYRINDLLTASGGMIDNQEGPDFGIVVRPINIAGDIETLYIDLTKSVFEPQSGENILLQPQDKLIILTNNPPIRDEKIIEFESALESSYENRMNPTRQNQIRSNQIGQNSLGTPPTRLISEKNSSEPDTPSEYSRNSLIEPILNQLSRQARRDNPLSIVEIKGEVKFPGRYPLANGLTLTNLIKASGGLTESAYLLRAEINRMQLSQEGADIEHLTVSLEAALKHDEKNTNEITLNPRDVVSISKMPEWEENRAIEIAGEVTFPGSYEIHKGETLSQVIKRAGGITSYAYLKGAVFTRNQLRENEQQRLSELKSRLDADIAAALLKDSQDSPSGTKHALAEAKVLLERLNKIEPEGRLVIDLDSVVKDPKHNDIVLLSGDKLFIPQLKQSVSVIGEVQFPTSHLYDQALDIENYIERSGGTTPKADVARIYIVKANGSVILPNINNQWFWQQRENIEPGDTVVVPLDSERFNTITVWSDLSQIFYQLALGAAALNSF